jgi:hypothetical protein
MAPHSFSRCRQESSIPAFEHSDHRDQSGMSYSRGGVSPNSERPLGRIHSLPHHSLLAHNHHDQYELRPLVHQLQSYRKREYRIGRKLPERMSNRSDQFVLDG